MNLYLRMVSCAALLGLSLTALSQYRPDWASRTGLDWWSLPELRQRLWCAEQESAALDERVRPVLTRIRAKVAVIEELRGGRLTLAEATARFRLLNAAGSQPALDTSAYFPGATEEERLCRQVVRWAVSAAGAESTSAGEATARRLGAELDGLLARNGGRIELPD
jgi:hypothetical protein